jgi:hypothetical protein
LRIIPGIKFISIIFSSFTIISDFVFLMKVNFDNPFDRYELSSTANLTLRTLIGTKADQFLNLPFKSLLISVIIFFLASISSGNFGLSLFNLSNLTS